MEKEAAGGFVKKNNHFQIKEVLSLDGEQMAGAGGLLSLPLVTQRSKLRQLQLNMVDGWLLPPSVALFLPRTLSDLLAQCQKPILQPMFGILRVTAAFTQAASLRHRVLCTPREAAAIYRERSMGMGGPGRDEETRQG